MGHLRLVTDLAPAVDLVDDRPRVSLRLLMAASGRCSCDDCVRAYLDGDRSAGTVTVSRTRRPTLTSVR